MFSAKTLSFVGTLALILCPLALAQQGGAGPGAISPEKAAKIWAMEAQTVASQLNLNAEQTQKLVDAYKTARQSQLEEIRSKMGEAGQDRTAFVEINKAQRAKLETALNGFLKADQTAKAMPTLGSFSRRWDVMVATLDEMNLDEQKKGEAMKLVADYAAESGKLMESAMAGGGGQNVREQMVQMKDKLDASLAKVLTPEQLTKWKEGTARRGRGGAGPRGGAGGAEGKTEAQPAPKA
jgi:Spy/CpxP family protein refolding chaperone